MQIPVSVEAKISSNWYNPVRHRMGNRQNTTHKRAKRLAISQQVTTRLHRADKKAWQTRNLNNKNDLQKVHLRTVTAPTSPLILIWTRTHMYWESDETQNTRQPRGQPCPAGDVKAARTRQSSTTHTNIKHNQQQKNIHKRSTVLEWPMKYSLEGLN